MNWDNQLSSILSVADGSVAKMRVSTFKYFYLYVLIHTEAGFFFLHHSEQYFCEAKTKFTSHNVHQSLTIKIKTKKKAGC